MSQTETDKPKHPGGRPTKLTDELMAQARDYITNYQKYDDVHPSIVGMACALKVCEASLYNWGESNSVFLGILEDVRAAQHKILLNNGLAGKFNPTITKLILTKHGYSDRQDNNVTGTLDVHSLSEKQIDNRLAQLLQKAIEGKADSS